MSKFAAHGASVSIAGTDIGGMVAIGLPDETRGEVETTDHNSGGDREFLPGLRDGGSISLEGHLDPEDAGQVALRTNYDATGTAAIVITLPATAAATEVTYSFDAFVTAMGGDLPGDSDETGSLIATLKVSGAVTVAIAST